LKKQAKHRTKSKTESGMNTKNGKEYAKLIKSPSKKKLSSFGPIFQAQHPKRFQKNGVLPEVSHLL